jgi:hypothetical protein
MAAEMEKESKGGANEPKSKERKTSVGFEKGLRGKGKKAGARGSVKVHKPRGAYR